MAETSHELRKALLKLSLAERLELVQELWDSIAAECEQKPFPLTDDQRRDLERRLAEADAHPERAIPWN